METPTDTIITSDDISGNRIVVDGQEFDVSADGVLSPVTRSNGQTPEMEQFVRDLNRAQRRMGRFIGAERVSKHRGAKVPFEMRVSSRRIKNKSAKQARKANR